MASIALKITDDCRFLSAMFSSSVIGPGTLTISNNGTQIFETLTSIPSVGEADEESQVAIPISDTWNISEQLGENTEILSVQFTDLDGNIAIAGILNSCFLDCCLAQKVLDLADCKCGEPQCDKNLVESQRLFLTIQSIKTLLTNMGTDPNIAAGIIERAVDAYATAKNQCSSYCGCNC
jgi:hypothetical protein